MASWGGNAPGDSTCVMEASGLRGGERDTGFLMENANRWVARFLIPLELFDSLWFFA